MTREELKDIVYSQVTESRVATYEMGSLEFSEPIMQAIDQYTQHLRDRDKDLSNEMNPECMDYVKENIDWNQPTGNLLVDAVVWTHRFYNQNTEK